MSYTNFAYYFRPHGWIQQHNPRKFYLWGQRRGRSATARNYCYRKALDMAVADMWRMHLLHKASRYKPRPLGRIAPSINHMRDGHTCYRHDELAASCGL